MITTKKVEKPSIEITKICDALSELKYRERVIEKTNDYKNYFDDLKSLYNDELKVANSDKEFKPHMKKMYSERFSNKAYPNVYKFYKAIRSAQAFCPYCNIFSHQVTQLDHYFPKSKFPSLSITPANLVPICTDCNTQKKEFYSTDKNSMFIHPYFDEFIKNPFEYIRCKIVEESNIGFIFYVEKPDEWDDCQFKRATFHFEKLNLKNTYRTYFEEDFHAFLYEIIDVYLNCGSDTVLEHIERKMNSYIRSGTSPWLYAGYKALLESNWFINVYLKKHIFEKKLKI